MKTPKSVGDAYDISHDEFLSSVGEPLDITSAVYNGNWSKSLEQAQRDKHDWVLKGINFQPGQRVLDVGCGWGPMLDAVRNKGGIGKGLTVSKKQADYCKKKGLDVVLQDWKETNSREGGAYDGIISIGAFEHFCSQEEHLEGKQKKIYDEFFKFCHDSLKDNGRLYLQTMTWGFRVPDYPREFDVNAKKGSDEKILGALFALSSWWPPTSKEQIIETAEPYFEFIDGNNGREDYVRTFREWHQRFDSPHPGKLKTNIGIFWKYITEKDSRQAITAGIDMLKNHYFREAFISHILSHERMFFERRN